jgi:hypothetical protein
MAGIYDSLKGVRVGVKTFLMKLDINNRTTIQTKCRSSLFLIYISS